MSDCLDCFFCFTLSPVNYTLAISGKQGNSGRLAAELVFTERHLIGFGILRYYCNFLLASTIFQRVPALVSRIYLGKEVIVVPSQEAEELVLLSALTAITLARGMSVFEITLTGSFLTAVADQLFLLAVVLEEEEVQ